MKGGIKELESLIVRLGKYYRYANIFQKIGFVPEVLDLLVSAGVRDVSYMSDKGRVEKLVHYIEERLPLLCKRLLHIDWEVAYDNTYGGWFPEIVVKFEQETKK